jgi:hypothetical protein
MRTSDEIQKEYEEKKKKGLDSKGDKVYQEAIRRAKLEEQAKDKRDFEDQVDRVMHGSNDGAGDISPIPFVP